MADLIGQTLGAYRIESQLGAGGMGEVYRGTHTRLNRPAAIKVLHANQAADPTFQARFLREARAAAALSHPNIVEVFDFGDPLHATAAARIHRLDYQIAPALDRDTLQFLRRAHFGEPGHRDTGRQETFLHRQLVAGQFRHMQGQAGQAQALRHRGGGDGRVGGDA